MRRPTPAAVICALALGACVTGPRSGSPHIQTTGDANKESLRGAAEAPLRDLNVLRTKIPPVLLAALADPYDRPPGRAKCQDLAAMVKGLDDALGADLDTPSTDEDDLLEKGKEAAYGALAGATTDVIPFRGWVRKLSGAERHDKFVQAAINSGAVRRAYLKGLGEAKGCNPPATQSHLFAGRAPITQEVKPKYPTRRPNGAPGTPAETPPAGARR
jgi:hypothetical protein